MQDALNDVSTNLGLSQGAFPTLQGPLTNIMNAIQSATGQALTTPQTVQDVANMFDALAVASYLSPARVAAAGGANSAVVQAVLQSPGLSVAGLTAYANALAAFNIAAG